MSDLGWQAVGAQSEHLAVAKLLSLGYKVAVPVVDDDGVDLVVDYRTTVQVRSCAHRPDGVRLAVALRNKRPGRGSEKTIARGVVDFLLVHARDSGAWWVIPVVVLGHGQRLFLREEGASKFGRYLDAWHLFDRNPELEAVA